MTENSSFLGYMIIIIAVFTWSLTEVIIKKLQGSVGPLSLAFLRFFIGGIFLLCVLIAKNDIKGIIKIIRDNLPLFLFVSCVTFGISNIFYFIGVSNTQANIAATLFATYPVWITFYSIFILNEKTNLKFKFVGMSIGILGVAILITNFDLTGFFSATNFVGNLLVLIGSLIFGLYSVLGKKIQINVREIPNIALKFSMISSLFACIPIFVLLIFTPEINTFLSYNLDSWFWIFIIGLLPSGIGTYLLFEGIKKMEVSRAMSLAFLKPIFATILAYFILNEIPNFSLLISILLVVSSVIIINKNPTSNLDC
jgi:drug/metabolite transporter (DMT)-like permease